MEDTALCESLSFNKEVQHRRIKEQSQECFSYRTLYFTGRKRDGELIRGIDDGIVALIPRGIKSGTLL